MGATIAATFVAPATSNSRKKHMAFRELDRSRQATLSLNQAAGHCNSCNNRALGNVLPPCCQRAFLCENEEKNVELRPMPEHCSRTATFGWHKWALGLVEQGGSWKRLQSDLHRDQSCTLCCETRVSCICRH